MGGLVSGLVGGLDDRWVGWMIGGLDDRWVG